LLSYDYIIIDMIIVLRYQYGNCNIIEFMNSYTCAILWRVYIVQSTMPIIIIIIVLCHIMSLNNFGKVLQLLMPSLNYHNIAEICSYIRNYDNANYIIKHDGGSKQSTNKDYINIDKLEDRDIYEKASKLVKIYKHKYTRDSKIYDIEFRYVKTNGALTFTIETPLHQKSGTGECLAIKIERTNNIMHAHIQNVSYFNNCMIKLDKVTGSILLDVALDLIKSLKSQYKIKGVQVLDLANISCPKRGKIMASISLARLYTLLHGVTWYGSRGFKPGNYGEYDNNDTKAYKRNKYIIQHTKTKDIPLYDILHAGGKGIISTERMKSLREYIHKQGDALLCETLIHILEHYDKTCYMFHNSMDELFATLKLKSFHGMPFYLEL